MASRRFADQRSGGCGVAGVFSRFGQNCGMILSYSPIDILTKKWYNKS